MILDADCHISPTPEGGNSITHDELIQRMDRAGVDKALVWLQPPYLREIDKSNQYVYEAQQKYPERIVGFGWADPNLGIENARNAVRRSILEYGFPGVKLNGAQNSFYIDDPDLALPVIEEIVKLRGILAFHIGGDAYEHTHPFRAAKIAKRFPELRILVVHMGGAAFADLSNAAIEFARECPNMTLIASAVRDVAVLKAIKVLGAKRVCFGSDTPFALMHAEVAKMKAILEDFPEEDRQCVLGKNMAELFGL